MNVSPEKPDTETDGAEPRLLHAVTDKRLAIAWLVAFLAGLIAISSHSDYASIEVFVVPSGILILYMLFGLTARHRNTGKFADSIYFMGFIWTLVALINAVVLEKTNTTDVFRAFGYALITTGLGMSLRILILQFHTTGPDIFEKAENDLDNSMAKFVSGLEAATASIERIPDAVTAEVQVDMARLHTTIDGITTALSGLSAKTYEPAIAETRQAITQFAHDLEGGSELLRLRVEAFQSTIETLSTLPAQLEQLTEKIEKLGDTVLTVDDMITTAADRHITTIASDLSQFQSTVAKVREMGFQLTHALEEITAFLHKHLTNDGGNSR